MKSNRPTGLIAASILLLLAAGLIWNSTSRKPAAGGEAGNSSQATGKSRSSDRSEADPDRDRRRNESISLAAQKWYEELLEKYPRMKPDYRDVPDAQNGYLQLLNLLESPNVNKSSLSDDLISMLRGDSEWDVRKFDAFQAENHEFFEKLLQIAELPDQSAKGVDFFGRAQGLIMKTDYLGMLLRSSARNAFEKGDQETALRYLRASTSIASHLVEIETPSLIGGMISASIRNKAEKSFREDFLPALANDPVALRAWSDAIFAGEPPSEEYSRVVIGEWNTTMRNMILPALLRGKLPGEPMRPINDPGEFLDIYTALTQETADIVSGKGPNHFDATHAGLDRPVSGLPPEAAEMFAGIISGYKAFNKNTGKNVTTTAMNFAVISILLGETPPVDPVSGKPFTWDPETRLLGAPEGEPEMKPIKVP